MSSITWDSADFTWGDNPHTWDEVVLAKKLAAGDDFTLWKDFDKKKLVKLILKDHGDTITETKQTEIKQYKIRASDIKLTVEKVLGIEIMTENIKF